MSSRADLSRRHRAGFGAIAVVLSGALSVLIVAVGNGYYVDGYRLTADFPTSSQGLFTDGGTDVKIRGVEVGTVDEIESLDDGRARLTLLIDPDVRVPSSAAARVEPLSVFGPKFIALDPGELESRGPWLADGDQITEVSTDPELNAIIDRAADLLDLLDPAKVQSITSAVAEGVAGLGDDIGVSIDDGATLAGVGARHAGELRLFLTDLAALTGTAADSTPSFLATVEGLNRLLPTINQRSDDLDELLDVTTRLSNSFSALVARHGDDLGVTIDALRRFVHGIASESEQLPDVLDLIGTYFGSLSDITRFDGPAGTGTKLSALRGFIALDLCQLLGICPGGAP